MSNSVIRNCVFGYQCDQSWDDLIDTNELTVKHCVKCDRDVFCCASSIELMEAIRANKCVAVDFLKENKKRRLLGTPEPIFDNSPSEFKRPMGSRETFPADAPIWKPYKETPKKTEG